MYFQTVKRLSRGHEEFKKMKERDLQIKVKGQDEAY